MGCPRISYVRRMHYATRSNQVRKIRTPGNRLVFQKVDKRSQGPHTPWVLGHKRLAGTKALNHFDARTSSSHAKSVSRAYGGVLSAEQVRDRIIRAFLVEEQRIARRMDLDKKKYKKLKVRRLNKDKKKKAKTAAAAKKVGARVPGVTVAAKKGGKTAAAPAKASTKTGAPAKATTTTNNKKANAAAPKVAAKTASKGPVGAKLA